MPKINPVEIGALCNQCRCQGPWVDVSMPDLPEWEYREAARVRLHAVYDPLGWHLEEDRALCPDCARSLLD